MYMDTIASCYIKMPCIIHPFNSSNMRAEMGFTGTRLKPNLENVLGSMHQVLTKAQNLIDLHRNQGQVVVKKLVHISILHHCFPRHVQLYKLCGLYTENFVQIVPTLC